MRLTTLILHSLLAGIWLGAMVYSLFVLHPRARRFFANTDEFEAFIATLAQGARWKVLGLAAAIGATGAMLVAGDQVDLDGVMVTKIAILAAALAVFAYTSWVLWPRRIFATSEEAPAHQRRFRFVAAVMILLVLLASVLGIAHRS